MTKKEIIEAMKGLDGDAEVSIFCTCSDTGLRDMHVKFGLKTKLHVMM